MNKTITSSIRTSRADHSLFSDYMLLVKMRLTSLVVFTAVMSYLIASGLDFSVLDLIVLGIGGFCVTAASNALNQVLEKDFDKLMTRTADRPLAAGRMTVSHAVMFAGLLCLIGVTALATFNVWAAFLGMLAFVMYAFVYTPLKRFSSAAVFVGGIAGAMPMMIGVVAFQGGITTLALILFAIQFAWQYPHFWAIGFLGYDDYKKAGFKFVPSNNNEPSKSIARSSIFYTTCLVLLGAYLLYSAYVGSVVGGVVIILGLVFLYFAISFNKTFNKKSARNLMFCSLLYLPLVLIVMLIDKLI